MMMKKIKIFPACRKIASAEKKTAHAINRMRGPKSKKHGKSIETGTGETNTTEETRKACKWGMAEPQLSTITTSSLVSHPTELETSQLAPKGQK